MPCPEVTGTKIDTSRSVDIVTSDQILEFPFWSKSCAAIGMTLQKHVFFTKIFHKIRGIAIWKSQKTSRNSTLQQIPIPCVPVSFVKRTWHIFGQHFRNYLLPSMSNICGTYKTEEKYFKCEEFRCKREMPGNQIFKVWKFVPLKKTPRWNKLNRKVLIIHSSECMFCSMSMKGNSN